MMIEAKNSEMKENAIYVCIKCQNIVLVSKESFTSIEEKTDTLPNSDSFESKNSTNVSNTLAFPLTICLSFQQNDWLDFDNFDKIQQFASKFPNFPFPICPTCLNSYNKMRASIDSTIKVQDSFTYLMKQTSFGFIENSIHKIEDDINDFVFEMQSQLSIQTSVQSPLSSKNSMGSSNLIPKMNREVMKIQEEKPFYETDNDLPLNKPSHLSLTLATTFVIATDRHYITINNMRIGFYLYSRNTVEENNIGLSFLSHLMWSLLGAYHISFDQFEIYPSGIIRMTKDNSIYNLKIPIKKNLSEMKKFNVALDVLFIAASQLFLTETVMVNCGAPPFEINVTNRTIDNASYAFEDSAKNLEKWSLAMKYLLFNVKLVQIRSATRFLSD